MKNSLIIIIFLVNYILLTLQNIKNPNELIANNGQNIQNIQKSIKSREIKEQFLEFSLDKIITYEYIEGDTVWFSEKKLEYGILGELVSSKLYRFSGRYDEVRLEIEEYYTYNSDKRLLFEKSHTRFFDWDPTQYQRSLYTYNESDSLTEELSQGKDKLNADWINGIQFSNKYDENDLLVEHKFEMWQDGNWFLWFTIDYFYDANQILLETIFEECITGVCVESGKNLIKYDEFKRKIKEISLDKLEDDWINSSQRLYLYDSRSNLIEEITQHWDAEQGVWKNASRTENLYDNDNHLISTTKSSWGESDWIYSQRWDYFYQAEYKIEELYYAYDNGWINQTLTTYHYEGLTDVNVNSNLPSKFELSQNYPNPFNPSTVINYSIPNETHPFIPSREGKERSDRGVLVTIKVYDILGKEVATLVNENKQPGNYEVEFDASQLSSGIYFYKLQSGKFIETKKMVLLR